MNRQTAIIDANGRRTEMKYDLAGRLIKAIDGNGHRISTVEGVRSFHAILFV